MSWLRGLIGAGVRNPVYANMLMVCILAGGMFSARNLVTETYPSFSLDRIAVEVAYPGASPVEVERGVCIKIEDALESLHSVKRIWSRSAENSGLVMIELADGADAGQMVLNIKDRIGQITSFPPEIEPPIVREKLVRSQVINVAVHGNVRERTLKVLAEEIKDELLARDEVSQVNLTGVRNDEIAIQVSREALLRYGLSLEDIAAVVRANCVDLPGGALRTKREELVLRTTGQRFTAAEFEDLVVIAQADGTLIKLGQIANVRDGFEEQYRTGRFDGRRAAIIEVFKTSEQSTGKVARAVRDYVEQKRTQLPAGIAIDTWADSSREVDARIEMLVENGLWGIVLVVAVLALLLDGRSAIYVAVGIPVAFAGAMIVLHLSGQTLNMLSLFGLIMVTGIIVDDAIVIADGIRIRRASGDAPELAAVSGAAGVGLPVVAASVTTILAFVPLLMVVGIMGKFIAVLPVVVIAAVVFSGIEAFCILPAHLRHGDADGAAGPVGRRLRRLRDSCDRSLSRFVERVYRPLLARVLDGRGAVLAVAGALLILAAGGVLGGRIPFTLLPNVDGDVVRARVRFPPGVSGDRAVEAAARLEASALRLNDRDIIDHAGAGDLVARRFASIGEWSGWIDEYGSHLCEVVLELMPAEQRRLSADAVLAAWRRQTGTVGDALAVTFDRVQRGPTEKPLEIRLLGEDLSQLEMAADEVASKFARYAGVSGVEHDLMAGKREVRVRLMPLARTLGIAVDDLARQLRTGFHGGEALRVQRGRDEVRVQVRFPDDERRTVADIEKTRIRGPGGREIPFRELADYTIERGYAAIFRQDGKHRVRVMADVDERHANAERILAQFVRDDLPAIQAAHPGLSVRLEGQHAQMTESMRSLSVGFAFALVLIYAVLASMLRSYVQPLVILVAVPLGFVGAIAGHAILGYDLTIMSVFGLVALSGVVVNDALVLLDQSNANVREGRPIREAVIDAGALRFRAVLLTSVTTIVGLAPLMLERSTQAQTLIPMAVSLTFGLAAATVLTLAVVPALFVVVNDLSRFVHWLRHGGAYPAPDAIEAQDVTGRPSA